ncbi:MAG: hypothetical protein CSA19_01375, partial [Deltaproteobacteria bacterium]
MNIFGFSTLLNGKFIEHLPQTSVLVSEHKKRKIAIELLNTWLPNTLKIPRKNANKNLFEILSLHILHLVKNAKKGTSTIDLAPLELFFAHTGFDV